MIQFDSQHIKCVFGQFVIVIHQRNEVTRTNSSAELLAAEICPF